MCVLFVGACSALLSLVLLAALNTFELALLFLLSDYCSCEFGGVFMSCFGFCVHDDCCFLSFRFSNSLNSIDCSVLSLFRGLSDGWSGAMG